MNNSHLCSLRHFNLLVPVLKGQEFSVDTVPDTMLVPARVLMGQLCGREIKQLHIAQDGDRKVSLVPKDEVERLKGLNKVALGALALISSPALLPLTFFACVLKCLTLLSPETRRAYEQLPELEAQSSSPRRRDKEPGAAKDLNSVEIRGNAREAGDLGGPKNPATAAVQGSEHSTPEGETPGDDEKSPSSSPVVKSPVTSPAVGSEGLLDLSTLEASQLEASQLQEKPSLGASPEIGVPLTSAEEVLELQDAYRREWRAEAQSSSPRSGGEERGAAEDSSVSVSESETRGEDPVEIRGNAREAGDLCVPEDPATAAVQGLEHSTSGGGTSGDDGTSPSSSSVVKPPVTSPAVGSEGLPDLSPLEASQLQEKPSLGASPETGLPLTSAEEVSELQDAYRKWRAVEGRWIAAESELTTLGTEGRRLSGELEEIQEALLKCERKVHSALTEKGRLQEGSDFVQLLRVANDTLAQLITEEKKGLEKKKAEFQQKDSQVQESRRSVAWATLKSYINGDPLQVQEKCIEELEVKLKSQKDLLQRIENLRQHKESVQTKLNQQNAKCAEYSDKVENLRDDRQRLLEKYRRLKAEEQGSFFSGEMIATVYTQIANAVLRMRESCPKVLDSVAGKCSKRFRGKSS